MSYSTVTSRARELKMDRMPSALMSQQEVRLCRARWAARFRTAQLFVYHFLPRHDASTCSHTQEGYHQSVVCEGVVAQDF